MGPYAIFSVSSLLTRPNMVGLIVPFLTGHFHAPLFLSPTRPRTPLPCARCVPPDTPNAVSARKFFLALTLVSSSFYFRLSIIGFVGVIGSPKTRQTDRFLVRGDQNRPKSPLLNPFRIAVILTRRPSVTGSFSAPLGRCGVVSGSPAYRPGRTWSG